MLDVLCVMQNKQFTYQDVEKCNTFIYKNDLKHQIYKSTNIFFTEQIFIIYENVKQN